MIVDRRTFLITTGAACALSACPFSGLIPKAESFDLLPEATLHPHPALHYEKQAGRKVKCQLCPRECVVDDQERGYCGVRENRGGDYYTLVWGRPVTLHIDPIEKKPLFHFLPGTEIFSLATVGCNVNCKFCQNWQISQIRPEQERSYDAPPDKLVETARNSAVPSIAHTYTEPVIFYEYMKDIGAEAHRFQLKNVMISNGYIQQKAMAELLPDLDAVKIDLKAFTQKFYDELVVGELKPVLDTLKQLVAAGMWTEIVYLVIPTHNDAEEDIRAMSDWIVNELGPNVPLHYSRFHPEYMLKTLPPTPIKTLERCRRISMDAGIKFVYIGNVPGHEAEHTYCSSCHKILIRRSGYRISLENIENGRCLSCGEVIPGVWE